MEQQEIIEGFETRAKRLGLSMSAVCNEAGIHPTTFSRWKRSGKNTAPVGASLRSLTALDAALSRAEMSKPA